MPVALTMLLGTLAVLQARQEPSAAAAGMDDDGGHQW